MAELIIPDEAMLREPNLLIPGKKPIGRVKIDLSNKLTDRLQFYVNLGVSTIDLVTGEIPSNALNPAVEKEWIGGSGIGHNLERSSSNVLSYSETKRLGSISEFSLVLLVNGYWPSSISQDMCGNAEDNSHGFRLFAPLNNPSNYCRFRIADAGSNLNTNKINSWSHYDLVLFVCRYSSGKTGGHNASLYNLTVNEEITASTTTTSNCDFSYYDLKIGDASNTGQEPDAIFHFAGLWDKYLDDTDVDAIKTDPYQFLIPA